MNCDLTTNPEAVQQPTQVSPAQTSHFRTKVQLAIALLLLVFGFAAAVQEGLFDMPDSIYRHVRMIASNSQAH